jgi:hypothetical protein
MLLLARKAPAPMSESVVQKEHGDFFLLHYAWYTCACLLEKSVRCSGWVLCIEQFDNHMGYAFRYQHNLMHVHSDRSNAVILLSVPRGI